MKFIITEVVENGDELQVFGESDIYAVVSLNSVLEAHPGGDGYTADYYCDRANYHHIDPHDLWKDGSDKGRPVEMVAEVFDKVHKDWYDENDELIKNK